MATVEQIRTSIETKVFDNYGKTVTLKTQGTPTYNERGEILADDFTSSSISIVAYDIFLGEESMEPWGDLETGVMQVVMKYTDSVSVGDYLEIDGQDWEVKQEVPHWLPDNLVTIVRIEKVLG